MMRLHKQIKFLKWLTPTFVLAFLSPGCAKSEIADMQVVGPQGAYCTTLSTGRDVATGSVCVSMVDDHLDIAFVASNGWSLDDARLWLGGDIQDAPLVSEMSNEGVFPHRALGLGGSLEHRFSIPLVELGGEDGLCQGELHLIAQAAQQRVDINVSEQALSYADGPRIEPQDRPTYFSIGFSCPEQLRRTAGRDLDDDMLRDGDGDGVAAAYDCDDNDARVGTLLFEDDFEGTSTELRSTSNLTDSWTLANGSYSNDRGGEQARLIPPPANWQNTVTYATVSAGGLESACTDCAFDARQYANGFALSLPGLYDGNTSHIVEMFLAKDARFRVDKDSRTATLEGRAVVFDLGGSDVIESGGFIGEAWNLSLELAHRGQGVGGEGDNGPNTNGGQQSTAITDQWNYYDLLSGKMIRADGSAAMFTQRGVYPFQVGPGANGETSGLGATMAVDVTVEWTDIEMVGANHTSTGFGELRIDLTPRDRFRAGILARARLDATQNEGFEGYRCAIARNSAIDGHEPGDFIQLSAFLDQDVNYNSSECDPEHCPGGNLFDQLARVDHSNTTDILTGDSATLALWAIGSDLICEFTGLNGERVVAQATDSVFGSGTSGLSTLNALSGFDSIRVCQAFANDTDTTVDLDNDGVTAEIDCDDDNDKVGRLLFEEDFSTATTMTNTVKLTDAWNVAGEQLTPTRGGQQALLGPNVSWQNTVTYASVKANGMESKCRDCGFGVFAFEKANGNAGHALWLPGLYDGVTGHRVRMRLVEGSRWQVNDYEDTAALHATAVVYDLGGADTSTTEGAIGEEWTVTMHFRLRGMGPAGEGSNGPKTELPGDQQTTDITDLWRYYDIDSAVMTRADGSTVTFTQRSSYPMQVGIMANGKNTNLGASVWFDFVAEWTNTETVTTTTGYGDLNVDLMLRDRFRAGILVRAEHDADQDEGYHGYRCAVARNSIIDCHDPGQFVQLAAFMDEPEDDISSECDLENCPPNTTFAPLGREERGANTADVLVGETAHLVFWAVGSDLVCEYTDENGDAVTTRNTDTRFSEGTTGVSTLNAFADFEYIKVCEAFGVPSPTP